MYEAVIDRERKGLGLPRVSRGALLDDADSFPSDIGFRERDWLASDLSRRSWLGQRWVRLRKRLVVCTRAVRVWAFALAILAVGDLVVFVYSAVELGCEVVS
jgi:hypothetical protein